MKYKILLLSVTLSFQTISSIGQSIEFTDKALDKLVLELNLDGPQMFTVEMKQELQLTQEQYQSVEQVNKARFEQLVKAEEAFANDPEQLQKASKEINRTSDKALFTVLTSDQLKQYLKLSAQKEKFYYSINQED